MRLEADVHDTFSGGSMIASHRVRETLGISKRFQAFRVELEGSEADLGTLYMMNEEVGQIDVFMELVDAVRDAWPFEVPSQREFVLPEVQLYKDRPWLVVPDSLRVAASFQFLGKTAFASLQTQLSWLTDFKHPLLGESGFAHGDVRADRIALLAGERPLLVAPGWVAACEASRERSLAHVRADDAWHVAKLLVEKRSGAQLPAQAQVPREQPRASVRSSAATGSRPHAAPAPQAAARQPQPRAAAAQQPQPSQAATPAQPRATAPVRPAVRQPQASAPEAPPLPQRRADAPSQPKAAAPPKPAAPSQPKAAAAPPKPAAPLQPKAAPSQPRLAAPPKPAAPQPPKAAPPPQPRSLTASQPRAAVATPPAQAYAPAPTPQAPDSAPSVPIVAPPLPAPPTAAAHAARLEARVSAAPEPDESLAFDDLRPYDADTNEAETEAEVPAAVAPPVAAPLQPLPQEGSKVGIIIGLFVLVLAFAALVVYIVMSR